MRLALDNTIAGGAATHELWVIVLALKDANKRKKKNKSRKSWSFPVLRKK